jgi:serine/threonine protein kinase
MVPIPLSSILSTASDDLIDLLKRFLQFDPKKRITCIEALHHPFLKEPTKISTNVQVFDLPSIPLSPFQMDSRWDILHSPDLPSTNLSITYVHNYDDDRLSIPRTTSFPNSLFQHVSENEIKRSKSHSSLFSTASASTPIQKEPKPSPVKKTKRLSLWAKKHTLASVFNNDKQIMF